MKTIEERIRESIQNHISDIVDLEIKLAQERIEKRIKEDLVKISVNLLNTYSIERMGQNLIIKILDERKSNGY